MHDSNGREILVVDDDQHIMNLVIFFLEGQGLGIHCAANGQEALRKIEERAYMLMITDLNMPGMDGMELARKARAIAPHMPIILGSGNISPEVQCLARQEGIDVVLTKPYDLVEMLSRVRQLIDGRKATS